MTTEVKARFVLDDAASSALEKIKRGVEHLSHKAGEAQSELGGMLKQTLAVAAGFQLSGVIDTIKELGTEAFNAAAANEEQIKGLAGLIAMTDKTGMSFEESMKKGEELKGELEKIGITAGQSGDQVIEAFSMIAERSGKSTEEVTKLTEQLAMAGRGTRGGIGSLASAFTQLEQGIVRPRNQLVQLMKQTGVVSGSAKEISKSLTAMMQGGDASKAKAFELAEQAVTRMAGKMKNMPLTFAETVKSLKILRENVFEALGGPMVKALTPALNNLKDYITKHKDAIEHYAEVAGSKIGDWVTKAAEKVEKGFQYLLDHSTEIEAAITKGVEMAKQVVEFILAHKEEIAMAYGAKVGAGAVGGAISAGKSAIDIGKGAIGLGGTIASMSGLAAGAASTALALGAVTVALASVAWAGYEGVKLWQDMKKDAAMEYEAKLAAIQRDAFTGNIAQARKWAAEVAVLNPAMKGQADRLVEETAKWAQFADQVEQMAHGGQAGNEQLVTAFQTANDASAEAQMNHVAQLIANGNLTATELEKLTATFKDGGKNLTEHIKKFNSELGASLEEKLKGPRSLPGAGTTPKGLNLNQYFSGGIHIKQDFKDQDPDRIIVAFNQRLASAGSAKYQAQGVGAGSL